MGPVVGAVLAGALWLPLPAAAQVLNFRHYTAAEGLPAAQVLALHQDARHYLWVGTYGGLSRFNGSEFRTYALSQGLASNGITAIAEDAQGRLHAGTIGGGLCTLDGASVRCLRAADGLPDDVVMDVSLDGDSSSLWVATTRGVARISNGVARAYELDDGIAGGQLNRIRRDRHGNVWVAGQAGLGRLDGNRFRRVRAPELRDVSVNVLLETRWGLLIGAAARLYFLHDGALVPLSLPSDYPAAAVMDAATAETGIWIATRAGVIHYDGLQFHRYTTGSGLLFDQVMRVRVDREGNVWFGTERGLSRLTPGPFRHYTSRDGLPNPFVRAITADHLGRIWLGTRDGVAVREGDTIRVVDIGKSLTDRRVFALAPLPDGGVLIGTRAGLLHHDGQRVVRHYRVADGLPGDAVPALLPDGSGGVWIGTDRGLGRWRDGVVTRVSGSEAMNAMFIVALESDDDGRLWLGGRAGGVIVFDGTRAVQLGRQQGLTEQSIWSIKRGRDGAVWIGSNGDGLYRVSTSNLHDIRRLTRANGLRDDFIWQIQPDQRGALWLYTNRGIDRILGNEIQHYGRGRGLLELEGAANASLLDGNGELWFGTAIGLVRYTPDLDLPAVERPPIYIEDITSGSDTLPSQDPQIRAGNGVLKIRFAAPTFRDETSVRFRYRLVGAADEWSEPTSERSIGYAGLAPGHYRFEVLAINADGVTSAAPATIAFVVAPRYWQTWWFRTAGVALLIAAAVGLAVARTRALQAERRRLEAVVAERTRELSAKNSDLEREVTERMRAEEAVRSSEQRLLEVVENSTNLFYTHDTTGLITYISPQSRRMLGCEPEEALRRWPEFATDNPINALGMEHTQRAIDTGQQQPAYHLELRGLDGVVRWVEVNETPVVDSAGRTIRIVGSLTDNTESKRAEAERERLESQLRQAQKMEAVGRLAGGIAHDFNNLLTAVVGNTDLVAAGLEPDHPLQPELAQVRQAADRAASLVAQLLAFSRQQLVRRRALDLNTVVTDAARMLRRMIGTDIELELVLAPESVAILADQAQLDQVLINLALNARDAMPEGGQLRITTDIAALDAAQLADCERCLEPGRYAALHVADTGLGMDAETIRHVFEPFYTTKDVGRGTGLGLATVYGIVTQNGGAVRIDSEAGHGTTFHIFLPLADEAQDVQPAAVTPTTGRLARATDQQAVVLVVEDEEAVRRLVCRALQRYGYRVLEAPDGATALDICARENGAIDLLLSDMVMPGMNGRDVATRITRSHPHVRVLFMSGHTRDVLGSRYLLDDATQLVQKPFAPADLLEHVRNVLA